MDDAGAHVRRGQVQWTMTAALMSIGLLTVAAHAFGFTRKHAPPDRIRFHLSVLGNDDDRRGACSVALNDRGQIVGIGGHWKTRPFTALRGKDQSHDFGQFSSREGLLASDVADINNRGQVVGCFQTEVSGAWLIVTAYGFVWTQGKITPLHPLNTIPRAINDQGEIAGEQVEDTPAPNQYPSHAVVWKNRKLIDLGLGSAVDINNSGTVVGNPPDEFEVEPHGCALRWQGGHVTELRALSSGKSRAYAINNNGLIVGNSDRVTHVTHAVAWRKGRLIDLGVGDLNSRALAVNDGGLIVGAACIGGEDRAVLWRGGQMLDLNQMLIGVTGWMLTEADKINARGQIIAKGERNGKAYYVLLTPHENRLR